MVCTRSQGRGFAFDAQINKGVFVLRGQGRDAAIFDLSG